jgi:hypothetical protein
MIDGLRRIHLSSYFLVGFLGLCGFARAFDIYPSFAEWYGTMENAFKILQSQEDKLLDPASANAIVVWPREWRTAARPEDQVLETEKLHDPLSVSVAENCRTAILSGAVLLAVARRGSSPGDEQYDRIARKYIQDAVNCESGLNIPHPENGFRARLADRHK